MKICMIGLGSIGCRHLKNVVKLMNERGLSYQIDCIRSSDRELSADIRSHLSNEFYSMHDIPDNYDVIFVTNPTCFHYDTIQFIRNKTKHIFIEKPIFHHVDYDIKSFKQSEGNIYYVACPLRYSPVIKYLKDNIDNEPVYSVRAISSSYLPDWRKNVDYRDIYSAKKSLGGGVSLDLIHEWDYLIYLFGYPENVLNMKGQVSHLEIDSEDLSIYIARYKDKLIELHLDYIGRNPTRSIEIYCKNCVIYGDILNNSITIKGGNSKVINFGYEDIYINEMNYFFDIVMKKKQNTNAIDHAYNVLKVALQKTI